MLRVAMDPPLPCSTHPAHPMSSPPPGTCTPAARPGGRAGAAERGAHCCTLAGQSLEQPSTRGQKVHTLQAGCDLQAAQQSAAENTGPGACWRELTSYTSTSPPTLACAAPRTPASACWLPAAPLADSAALLRMSTLVSAGRPAKLSRHHGLLMSWVRSMQPCCSSPYRRHSLSCGLCVTGALWPHACQARRPAH